MKTTIIEDAKRLGVETDINKRWENGTNHHEKSVALMNALSDIDFHLCGDYFDWNIGGDGDNGEMLMFELDIFFETQDAKNENCSM